MIETVRVEQWLYTILTGDTGAGKVNTLVSGRIYAYQAPEGAAFPFVVYSRQAGHDVMGVGAARIMASEVYQVKAVGKGATVSFWTIKAIADRIDEVLQGASGSVVDGRVLSCVREQIISYVENSGSDVYSHLGGLYRIQVQEVET